MQQQFQGLGPGLRFQHFDPAALQQRFQRDQVFRDVIDQQALDAFVLRFGGCQEHGVGTGWDYGRRDVRS
ncbi:hypothetical protein D3C81_2306410 [compost metagenome]